MMKTLRLLFFPVLLILPAVLCAQIPVGGVIEVATASWVPRGPDVAMGPQGDFVVGWTRAQPRDPSSGAFGRLYAADGSPRTREIRIGNRPDPNYGVRLAMMDDGSFLAVFRTGDSLVAQRFTSKGRPLGGPVTVARGELFASEVGSRGDGSFVVTWLGHSIFARAFGADGEPRGPEFPVAAASSYPPRLAVAPDGSFLVVWLQAEAVPSGYFVEGRLFNADGAPQGERFRISDELLNGFINTYDTTVDADGNFLVTWFDTGGGPVQPTAFVRRYTLDGAPLGEPAPAGHRPAGREIAAGPDGGFVSVWRGGADVVVRRFAASGAPLGPLVLLNRKPTGVEPLPFLAGNGTDSFVAAWLGKPQGRRGIALLVRRFRVE